VSRAVHSAFGRHGPRHYLAQLKRVSLGSACIVVPAGVVQSSRQPSVVCLRTEAVVSRFRILQGSDIDRILASAGRQYLVGDLRRPQELAHIRSDEIEIGISDYAGGEYEPPHFHPILTEYELVLWGSTEYYDIDTGRSHRFGGMDFYCIEPNVPYAQVVLERTRILFVKVPAIDDKTLVEQVPPGLSAWRERLNAEYGG